MPKPTLDTLQKITATAHIPAISYAYVDINHSLDNTTISYGKKNAPSTEANSNKVNNETRFPAASLSKIVFTYLVLRLLKEKHISLDEQLHLELPYERLMEHGTYPDVLTQENAEKITVRHVLSHTSGLPNLGSDPSSPLKFNSEPGKNYEYSGEAILYLQKFIEKKRNMDLQTLAQKYLFDPPPTGLGMARSTFLPPSALDNNIVYVHSELAKPMSIEESLAPFKDTSPNVSAVGTFLTTGEDFSKFLTAWLQLLDDEDFKKAFVPPKDKKIPTFTPQDDTPPVCGLGWHLYNDDDGALIAYQYGENTKMRAFVALNVHDKKAAAFFTNCEQGMSVAKQIFSSADLAPIGKTQNLFKSMPHHTQSDDPGWKETLAGKLAEDQGNIAKAKFHFSQAVFASNHQQAQISRLKWFNKAHSSKVKENTFAQPLAAFQGMYSNRYGDRCLISLKNGKLVYEQGEQEINLIRIAENDFLPEKDQAFKISINGKEMTRTTINGDIYNLSQESLTKSQEKVSEPPVKANLDCARKINQQYRHALETARNDNEESSAMSDYRTNQP